MKLDRRREEVRLRLHDAVENNWARQVDWLQTLVRFKSLPGQEAECQHWLAQEFTRRGWQVDRYTLAEQRTDGFPGHAAYPLINENTAVQVVATVSPRATDGGGRSLILQGHVDVVPEGTTEMWSWPPFGAVVEQDWLYGRGAQDMKMGISAMVFALDALAAAGLGLAAPVFVQTVTEEESSGRGALSALARGYRAEACLIPEPSGNTITRAQTGAIWFKVRVKGRPVHVADAQTGSNAILSAYGLIRALQDLTKLWNREATTNPWFETIPDPIKFNPGIIRGGDWASSLASWCELDCRIGVLPDKLLETAKAEIIEAVAMAAACDPFLSGEPPEVTWNGFQAEGSVLKPSEAEAALGLAHHAVFGTEMQERFATAVDDTRFYNHYAGIPGLCYGPAGENLHGFDERAYLPNLKQTTLVLALFIADWCGAR